MPKFPLAALASLPPPLTVGVEFKPPPPRPPNVSLFFLNELARDTTVDPGLLPLDFTDAVDIRLELALIPMLDPPGEGGAGREEYREGSFASDIDKERLDESDRGRDWRLLFDCEREREGAV